MDQAGTPLLFTKLCVPRLRPQSVRRPHLLERATLWPDTRLILVSAPAGFGKTTLLAELAATALERGSAVPCYSLDETDNDPALFLGYLAAALTQTLGGQIDLRPVETALRAAATSGPDQSLTLLINALADLDRDCLLVLDDYHTISAPAIHAAVGLLLDRLPPRMRLAIGSRADPPLQLARLRARAQLAEVRAGDLRFAPHEIVDYFRRALGVSLSFADAQRLEAATEGWAVSLQLVALALQQQPAPLQPAAVVAWAAQMTGRARDVFDYLNDEVLERQPPVVREFLLFTSVLERLSQPLCDAVTGGADSGTLLDRLDRANLFIVPLDNERHWFRYYHLFAEFLRARLEREFPGRALDLHRRAGAWHACNGWMAEGVRHTLAARDWPAAAQLIEQSAKNLWTRGEVGTLQRWLAALPAEFVRDRPRLLITCAWVHTFSGPLDAAEFDLNQAQQVASRWADAERMPIEGEIAALRTVGASLRGDVLRTIALAPRALELLTPNDEFLRSGVAHALGLAHRLGGDVIQAIPAFERAAALADRAGYFSVWLAATGNLVLALISAGRLHQAYETGQRTLRLAAERGLTGVASIGLTYAGLAQVQCEWNDAGAAERDVRASIEIGTSGTLLEMQVIGYQTLARARHAQGDWHGAMEALDKAAEAAQSYGLPRDISWVAAQRARLCLASSTPDRRETARRWAAEYIATSAAPGYSHEYEDLTLVRVDLAQGNPSQAVDRLPALSAAAEAAGRTGSLVEILALESLAWQACGDPDQALAALARALARAEPEGYRRLFLEMGDPLRALVDRWAHTPFSPTAAYAQSLMAALDGHDATQSETRVPAGERLSAREKQVLRLAADGLSNREIAAKLVVSLSTVKKHLENIHDKLGVHNRTQAIARARELELL